MTRFCRRNRILPFLLVGFCLCVLSDAVAAEHRANVSTLQHLAIKYAARWEAQRTPQFAAMLANADSSTGPKISALISS